MKNNKIILVFALLVLLLSMSVPVFAADEENPLIPEERQLPLLHDTAGLLTDEEKVYLWEKLESISEEFEMDIAIVTVPSLEGKTSQAFADDFYDYNGYGYGEGYDGMLLLVGVAERDAAITTYGRAIGIFTDNLQDTLWNKMMPHLSNDEWNGAFVAFANHVELVLVENSKFNPFVIVIALIIGLFVALIVTGSMKSQLKTVRRQPAAHEYVVKGSLNITGSSEKFLYKNVSSVRRSSGGGGGSSTHRSSSGRSHGGSSRKF